MKKISRISLTLIALMMVVALSACSGPAPKEISGTWELTGAEVDGQPFSIEMLIASGQSGEMSFEFKDAKKVSIKGMIAGADVKVGQTSDYTFEDDVVTITGTSPQLKLVLKDGKLLLDQLGVTMIFERK